MRVLITGGQGQLGRAVHRALPGHEVAAPGHGDLDVSDEPSVDAAFAAHLPQAVIHCAALTDTARCEREPDLAEAINARGTELIARACARHSARLVAVSTNEVFPGSDDDYVESAPTRALNAYGRSKLEAEQRAKAAHDGTLVVRTAWLYGEGATFPAKVLAAAREGRPLRFVTDEVASPTSCDDLARAIAGLIESEAPAGIYHLTNTGAASRYEWAAEILRTAGIERDIEATTTAKLRVGGYDGPVKPARTVLVNRRAAALGITLGPWQSALHGWWERRQVSTNG